MYDESVDVNSYLQIYGFTKMVHLKMVLLNVLYRKLGHLHARAVELMIFENLDSRSNEKSIQNYCRNAVVENKLPQACYRPVYDRIHLAKRLSTKVNKNFQIDENLKKDNIY